MVDLYLGEIMALLKDKYPDAVDVVLVNNKTVQESIGSIAIKLEEIEPESEIYAAMSIVTKKVYLFLTWKE